MESNTSDYRKTLHLLLQRLSSEVNNKNIHDNIHNNSKNLISMIDEIDSLLASPDPNSNELDMVFEDTSESSIDHLARFHIVINGYAVTIIAAIGLILNMIGIFFLSTGPRRGRIFSLLVSSLLGFDAIFLLFEIFKSLEFWLISIPTKYFKAYLITVSSGIRFSMISSILMLVAIARVRLCAMRNVFQLNHAILSGKERRNYYLRHCIPIVVASIILTLPLYFEIGDNPMESNDSDLVVTPTNLHLHPLFSLLYIGVLNLGILGLMPMVYLAYLNHHLRRELRKNKEQGERLGSNRSQIKTPEESNEDKATGGLVGIIIAFMIFHAFRVMTAIGEIDLVLFNNNANSTSQNGGGVPTWLAIAFSMNELFLVINASINVVIYLKCNSTELLETLMWKRRERSNRLRFKKLCYKKHHRKVLKKKDSNDSIISVHSNMSQVDEIEINADRNRNEEMEMTMCENNEPIASRERSKSTPSPARVRRLQDLSGDSTFELLEYMESDPNLEKRRASMMPRIMDV